MHLPRFTKTDEKYVVALTWLALVGLVLLSVHALHGSNIALFNPKGIVALKERNLIIVATLLMSIVVVPVLILTFMIAWRYRATNLKATYAPEWDHNIAAESVWWGIPCLIILSLAVITWNSSHDLDPAKALASTHPPITVQVIALPGNWLFIYPAEQIASLNLVEFPEDTPVNFEITSDAPMNSFWIPQLGSQIYAMSGMTTKLNLMADQPGDFKGLSANLSGPGFSGMKFTARSSSQADFDRWVTAARSSNSVLDSQSYAGLAKPSQRIAEASYFLGDSGLYDEVVAKFMPPTMQMQ